MISLLVVIIVVFGVLAYSFVIGLISDRLNGSSSLKWPSITGEVIKVEFEELKDPELPTSYWVRIEYRYSVYGESYIGRNIQYGYAMGKDKKYHHDLYTRFKNDKKLVVFYDPKIPTESTIFLGYANGN